jgi:hypothetical protein
MISRLEVWREPRARTLPNPTLNPIGDRRLREASRACHQNIAVQHRYVAFERLLVSLQAYQLAGDDELVSLHNKITVL